VASKWYILQVLSGAESKISESIKEKSLRAGLSNLIEEVIIPVEKVFEVKKGKKVQVEKKFLPGYILVKMDLTDDLWHVIKAIPKVGGFLGGYGKPQQISQKEVDRILEQIVKSEEQKKSALTYEVGDSVKVNDGPFESFVGTVETIDEEKQRLRVSVAIFGRATPIDLDYTQVTKI
jgi:transcriptional antiterminator NusG